MVTYVLRIPEDAYAGLEKLVSLGDGDFQDLLDAFRETAPTLHPDEFSAHVSTKVELESGAVNDIIDFILPLYAVRFDMGVSTPHFIDSIIDAVDRIPSDDLEISTDSKALLRHRLDEILTLDESLGVVSKSRYIVSQQERLFVDSRIFTELRPIFKDDPDELPAAGAILHRLKISYFESGRMQEFFVTMDANDIEKLRKTLNRASRKAASLRSLMNATTMQILEVESDE